MKKQILIILLKYGLGLGLVAWMIYSNWHVERDGKEVGIAAALDRTLRWGPFVLAVLVGSISIFITFVRWFVLVRALDLPFTMYNAVRLGLLGLVASTFLPGAVTGDLPKAYFLARGQNRRTAAVATVIMDRVLGLCALVYLVAIIGTYFWLTGQIDNLATAPRAKDLLQFIVATSLTLLGSSIAFWIVLGFFSEDRSERIAQRLEKFRFPRIGASLAELWRSVLMYRTRGRSVALAIALAMIGHLGFVMIFFFSSQCINEPAEIPSVGTHFLVVPVGMTIQAGIPTPGGIGGGEVAFSWLYAQVGAGAREVGAAGQPINTSPEGFLAALVNRVVFWVLSFFGYFIWLRMRSEADQVLTEAPSTALPSAP